MNNDKYDYTLEENQSKLDKPQFYSQGQICVCALLCGTLPVIWMLRRNFLTIGESEKASATMFWGILISIAIIETVFFLPDDFPSVIIPALLSWASVHIAASSQQGKLDELLAARSVARVPHWKTFLMSVILFALTIAIAFSLAFVTILVVPDVFD